jgi:hypothetical protein
MTRKERKKVKRHAGWVTAAGDVCLIFKKNILI